MKVRIIIGSLLFLILVFLIYLFANFDIRRVSSHKEKIHLTIEPELEKYVGCKNCLTTYREGELLYVETKQYPVLKGNTKEQKWEEVHRHVSKLGLLVGQSLRDTDFDTCRFVFNYSRGLMVSSIALSIVINEYADIFDKIQVAGSYCRAISDSDYTTAINFLAPDMLKNITQEKLYNQYNYFHSLGKITNIEMIRFLHDLNDNKNFLGVVLLVEFEGKTY